MADFPQIVATTPTTVPPTTQKVYNKYWLTNLNIMAQDPNRPVRVNAMLRKGLRNDNGTWELIPNGQPINVMIEDVFELAAEDAETAQIIGGLLAKIEKIAKTKKLI